MRPSARWLRSGLLVALLGALQCSDPEPPVASAGGGGGVAGSSGAAGSGAAGQGGAAGSAGQGGEAGAGGAGQGGEAAGASGSSGQAGAGGESGEGGESGASGQAGEAGAAGQAGEGGSAGAAGSVVAPYELTPLDNARITSDGSQPNFQHVSAPIDLTGGPFESVTIEVALATTCFPFEKWKDNPPPAGQNFPADCDAFDRNFETILDEPAADGDPPGLEVIRAITPFGGPLTVTADLTDLANVKPGPHTVHVRIPTWSDGAGQVSGSNGGWNVTVKVKVTPGTPPRKVLAVQPLFNLVQGSSDSAAVAKVQVPTGTTAARIEYRATGHGGGEPDADCIGPAEEFCKRSHTLTFDGAQLKKKDMWRKDCNKLCTLTHYGPASGGFDYCAENPTGAISSVKAPRANWCPGSETPPLVIENEALLAAGEHAFTYQISKIAEGGIWRLSGVFYAYGD